MTAQVEFFCSADEEREVLRYLTKDPGIRVFDVSTGSLTPWESFSVDHLPEWPRPLQVVLWQPAYGDLIWHDSTPTVAGRTHGGFVMNLFAYREWKKRRLGGRDKLLDTDLSPILHYRRGDSRADGMSQNVVLASPSSLARVGPEYERWVKRCLAWIRRRGTIVHGCRGFSQTVANPHTIASTIHAFPGVLDDIRSGNHGFVIAIAGEP
jgi:hypothetical protein